MSAKERRCEIIALSRRDGDVAVTVLSGVLGVSPETVRRDLEDLERQGLVKRTHGGAIPTDRPGYEGTVSSRSGQRSEEKARIARRALDEIGEAELIYLDEGSTVASFAAALDPGRPLTVITPAINVSLSVSPRPEMTIIQLAGNVRRQSEAVVGPWTLHMLSEIVIDLAVLGTNGISRETGFTAADASVAAVKRTAIAHSRRTIVLADASKFGHDSFASFGQITDVNVVVTGSTAPRSLLAHIRAAGVQVLIA